MLKSLHTSSIRNNVELLPPLFFYLNNVNDWNCIKERFLTLMRFEYKDLSGFVRQCMKTIGIYVKSSVLICEKYHCNTMIQKTETYQIYNVTR